VGILGPSKNTRISNGRSSLTHLVLFVSRHNILTTYDHRRPPQEPKTGIKIPNRSITFRFCCNWVFGVLLKILKNLMEGLHQHSLFYLCPGIVIQTHMTTGANNRNLRQAQLHPTQISLLESSASGYLGSFKK
jgi:hypothetical protein